ncbi:hypothetical protein [Sphingomicrobium flavum]|uniref:hypothetical protein n=1 Tax=Sphingomicrobium flavum TaxID=1229164 RepID=UPI0021AD5E81|nr:hypothetical protein [Sphingomicrobium flavum]
MINFAIDGDRIIRVVEAARRHREPVPADIWPDRYCLTLEEMRDHSARAADRKQLEAKLRPLEWRYFGRAPDRPRTSPNEALWYGAVMYSCDKLFALEQAQLYNRRFESRVKRLVRDWEARFGPQPEIIIVPVYRCSREDLQPRSNRFYKSLRRYEKLVEQLENLIVEAGDPDPGAWGYSHVAPSVAATDN